MLGREGCFSFPFPSHLFVVDAKLQLDLADPPALLVSGISFPVARFTPWKLRISWNGRIYANSSTRPVSPAQVRFRGCNAPWKFF